MGNEPDIVKELKEAEKLGQLKSYSKIPINLYETNKPQDGKIDVFEDDIKKVNSNIELKDIKEKYRLIFENSAVAITLTDENERIISWNKYTEKLLGYKEEDLNLKPVESLYPSEEWDKIRAENIRKKVKKVRSEQIKELRNIHHLLYE